MGSMVSTSMPPAGKTSRAYKSGRHSKVLVVDGESVTADSLAEVLRQSGYATEAAYDATDALEKVLLSPPELVITDVVLPGMSGVQLAVIIKRAYPDCKILLYSGHVSTPELIRSPHRAPYDFTLLSKPVRPRDLLALVEHRLGTSGSVLVPAAAEAFDLVHLS